MAINVGKRKRAIIGEDVIPTYKETALKVMRDIYENINSSPPALKKDIVQRKRGEISRLNSILMDNGPGKGIDLELTRLRGIDFHEISVVTINSVLDHRDIKWFVASTEGLLIQTAEGYGHNAKYNDGPTRFGDLYDCGDYTCYFPVEDLGSTRIDRIHFVPNDAPDTRERHFHHRANSRPKGEHPTDMIASTCWGGFAEPMAGAMAACDLIDVLRMMRIFVGRRNPRSILVHQVKTDKGVVHVGVQT